VFGGYAQSKWAAEKLILKHKPSRGRSKIIRLGLLTPNSMTGFRPSKDWFSSYLYSTETPQTQKSQTMDFSPVDIAAAHIVRIALEGENDLIYHLANKHQLSLDNLFQALKQAPDISRVNPYQALQERPNLHFHLPKTTDIMFSCINTQQELGKTDLFPKPTVEYLKSYIQKLNL